ncbi:PorP/SprF family type IX secretion system membrane protein [Rurimicrobium arvi]|uniref:Type IX secretion system membrane protein PorP/SprF n=1 Tax=Rurimicrobium arvi TaxID=2049916 RepID=A0ABP8MJQ9_9BACT
MTKKNIIQRVSLTAAIAISASCAFAQDIHFTQFNATPLILNPAFTGGFDGPIRASAIYRDQWRSALGSASYRTFAVSVDAPIVRDLTGDDYLAGGVQLYNDVAGDGNLSNFSGLLSVAYHKFLGLDGNKDLSVGLQGGYTSKTIDLSKLYFGSQFQSGTFTGPISSSFDGSPVRYFTVNAGIGYSHRFSDRFGLSLGVAGNNLNQPKESLSKEKNSDVGLGRRLSGQIGAIWYTGERFSVRPAVLYQAQSSTTEIIAGSEFHYIVAGDPEIKALATGLFLGGWYRNNDAAMVSAGIEHRGLRVGVAYDYNTSKYNTATNGKGGFEICLRFIGLNPINAARNLVYPCSRF